ncbi:O-antigen ligase family protein [Luteimonas sp. gir]|uniref:O-antigen ligase family protein n=1 Tax=Luteimonas sp. gir TaxID=3127960 RepID=UPI003075E187
MRISKLNLPVYALLLTPLWWLLGFGFFIFHFAALYMALVKPACLRPRDAFQYTILILISVLILSLLLNSLSGDTDISRMLAATNNASILGIGYIVYGFFLEMFRQDERYLDVVARNVGKVSLVSIVLGTSLLYFVLSGRIAELSFPTLIGAVTPPTDNLIGLYQRVHIISTDWFDQNPTPRLTILSTNATSSAALIAICGFISLGWFHRGSRFIRLAFVFLLMCTVAATLTRGAFFGLLAGLGIFMSMALSNKSKTLLLPAIPLLLVAAVMFLPAAIERANSARESSSSTRFASYTASIDVTMQGNPLFGLGIKPRSDDNFIPIGSHSTVLSTLVRGGLIGSSLAVIAFIVMPLAWFVKIGRRLLSSRQAGSRLHWFSVIAIAGVPSFIAFCLLQDIDAYAPLSTFLFCFLAMLSYCAKRSSELAGNAPRSIDGSPA